MIIETFTRIFVEPGAFVRTIDFYVALLSGQVTMRFAYPDVGLELASVSSDALSVLIIAGTPDRRAPFEATRLTIKVDRLESAITTLTEAGSEQLEPVQKTPVGRKTRFRHLDGTVVEYVDHDAASSD
ncbi:VOC family protein [Amorphus sp. 3PC139-8]|uniref:VOC family protein n=1 Tax=Amorphus sp. 3PC139-8 TaxID=2735676 RepID=UPI00345DD0F5